MIDRGCTVLRVVGCIDIRGAWLRLLGVINIIWILISTRIIASDFLDRLNSHFTNAELSFSSKRYPLQIDHIISMNYLV